jgi:hypothetical protein
MISAMLVVSDAVFVLQFRSVSELGQAACAAPQTSVTVPYSSTQLRDWTAQLLSSCLACLTAT